MQLINETEMCYPKQKLEFNSEIFKTMNFF